MKTWKEDLAAAVVNEARSCRIVMLKDVAAAAGYKHIARQDAVEIMRAAERQSADSRLVQLISHPSDSFFQSAALVDKNMEFFDGSEYEVM